MNNIDKMTVAEVVTSNIKTADIFKKNGIDFCCGGQVLVSDICKRKNIDYEVLKQQIYNLDTVKVEERDFNSWDLNRLVDYIVDKHHTYVKEAIPLILVYAAKVAKVHGHHYTEVVQINKLFVDLASELESHMMKEEKVLFPFVKKLFQTTQSGDSIGAPHFGTVNNPIRMMEAEHDTAGAIINKIASLSNQFSPPSDACNTFRALYAKLFEFQDDLFQHIHLENNILFPKAIKLEESILNAA